MDIYFLLLSLFFPRVVLIAYFLLERFPSNHVPQLASLVLGVFIPRVLILIYIYQNMGANNVWFIAHLAVMILAYFTGGTRTNTWRRRRYESRREF